MAQDEEMPGAEPLGHRSRHSEHDNLHRILDHVEAVHSSLKTVSERLRRMEKSAGRTEASVGACQGALERLEKDMARSAHEWEQAIDSFRDTVLGAIQAEGEQVRAEIARLQGQVGPDLEPQFARLQQMASDMATKIGQVWEAEAPAPDPNPAPQPEPVPPQPEPTPTPEPVPAPPIEPTPDVPSEARRRR